jgi:hypothetical protein
MELRGHLHDPAAVLPVPINKRLDKPQSRSGRFREEKNLFPLPGIEHRIVYPVA